MGLREILIVSVLLGGGYWYYQTHMVRQGGDLPQRQWEDHRQAMAACIGREERLSQIAGNAGVVRDTAGAETRCAEELGLFWEDGRWKSF